MHPDDHSEARAALLGAGYTVAGVRERLGPVAGAALAREETLPALRATEELDAQAVLLRLFWLQVPVPEKAVRAALPGLPASLTETAGEEVRARLRVEPREIDGSDMYVVSDLRVRPGEGELRADHVVGAGGAADTLAGLVVREPATSALDLGTGSGIQALHLAGRGVEVCATDVNPRALELTRLSAALSGLPAPEIRTGSLYEPVDGRRFDMIVSNPPFVISPGDGRYGYRESGLPGDALGRELVAGAPRHLNPGGWCHLLANWLHVEGEDWRDRVAAWAAGTGCDAWIVQRDVQDPAEYAELWLRDSCDAGTPRYRELYGQWLDELAAHRAAGVGFGWIVLHASGTASPVVRVEELRHAIDKPVGAYLPQVFEGFTQAQEIGDEELLGSRLRLADGVVQEEIGPPGAEDPERIVLRQTIGLRRAVAVGTVEAALAGVCDGTLPLEPLLAAIAELTGTDAKLVRDRAPAALRPLISDGFFTLAP